MAASAAIRVLILLPQSPLDPASGAARTLRTVGEMLARSGFVVRCLGTTASEAAQPIDIAAMVASHGVTLRREQPVARGAGSLLRFDHRGVEHHLLDVGASRVTTWPRHAGEHFDLLFDASLRDFQPDVLLTYGGADPDLRRRQRARANGCRAVLAVFSLGYLAPQFFEAVDAVLTPSEFITALYRERLGIDSVPLPSPVDLDDVVAPCHDPRYLTMVNPSIEKGVMFLARLVEELAVRDPDIPVQVVEARGTRDLLLQAALVGGFDLRRHDNLSVRPPVAQPREIYANTRVLVVPSVIAEASGRVVAEAQLNGIPTLVSDRGGLPENCGEGGLVLGLDPGLTLATRRPVRGEAVQRWVDEIRVLFHDQAVYLAARRRARRAGRRFHPAVVAPHYAEFVAAVASGAIPPVKRATGTPQHPD